MFYSFKQNNSGGSFNHDEKRGIGYAVIVEADCKSDAVAKAEAIGLYFDGEGDCSCCGNRWNDYCEGTTVPALYGEETPLDGDTHNTWGIPVYVHYKDGHVVAWENKGPVVQTKYGEEHLLIITSQIQPISN